MQEIEHCINQRPIYETDTGKKFEWDNPLEISGETKNQNYINYHPFVIDIETSAELGQRPILLVGYNTLEDRLIFLYSVGYKGYVVDNKKVKELAKDINPADIVVSNLSQSNVEKYVFDPIAKWNKLAKERNDPHRISLVAHNAEFDIPMLGSPDDKLLDNPKIGNQYEQAVSYKNIKMIGHRAGAFGHIFTFLDSSNNYEPLHIPVGDTLVTSKALRIPPKLEDACKSMGVDIDVSITEQHGVLNDEYVKYCINDVNATHKLYQKLQARIYDMFGNLPIEKIYSTASIGKFVLRKMNYKRVGYSQDAIDRIVPAYFGGRTDANITGKIVKNLRYTDILSQYPTISKLTNVWDFMQAEYITIKQINPKNLPEVDTLENPKNWEKIANYYVKINPNGATLPVRTPHIEDTTKVITANVESEKDLQYHYMDILASELIDGERKVDIKAAWKVEKHGKQELEGAKIAGVKIKPYDNVMAKGIESRKKIQIKENNGKKDERTKSLKIVANSLYGISAERIVKEIENNELERHDFAAKNGFYNPHVATTITAGGRLMLAFGEQKAKENGGKLIYCDTDSLIIPDTCANDVINAFNNLNPYEGIAGKLDVLEDEKGKIGNLYAVGTKKYVFFDNDGEILEFKEHGLGNYENLRDSETIKRLWATIIYYDLGHNPLNIKVLFDGKLNENVIWSFNASTRSMREIVNNMSKDYVRYGDWVESTLSINDTIRYVALDLKNKKPDDKIVKVKVEDETPGKIETIKKKEMGEEKDIKTVRDVVYKFVQDSAMSDERPDVNVTDLRIVTKEATSRKDIFMSKLEKAFNDNMEKAISYLNI
ncbi:MAG: DNA polymerase [Bacteroidales bacterium]